MPRRNRDRRVPRAEPRPLGTAGWQRPETAEDGDWLVRNVSATQATKTYRCPGCDHEIQPGVAHVVAWPADDVGSIEDRRHWHPGCWQARGRRRPTRKR